MKSTENFSNGIYKLYRMTVRNLKIFLKDKAAVFFSLLAPLIVLFLYVLFLGNIQVNSVESMLPESITVTKGAIKAFVDSWMLAGVLSIACITVSLGANTVMLEDKAKGVINDSLSAPVSRTLVTASYFLFNFIVTFIICVIVFAVCLIYLAASGYFYLSFTDILGILGTLMLSMLSATMITVFIAGFFKTEHSFSAFVGIMSAAIGFLIGAYMPLSLYPKAVQNLLCIIPGSYSGALFRNFFMRGALENLSGGLPGEFAESMKESFSMKFYFFGTEISMGIMTIILAGSVLLFFALNTLAISMRKTRSRRLTKPVKTK